MLTLAELNSMLKLDDQTSYMAMKEYKEAKAYYHGHQFNHTDLQSLEYQGRIPLYENIYKVICDKIMGYKLQASTEIKVSGRKETDKPLANVLTDLLKVFNQQNNYEKEIYKRDFDLLMGLSVIELWVQADENNDYHITLKSIPANSFLIDAYSTDKNALDSTRFHKKLNMNYTDARILLGTDDIILSKNDLKIKRCYVIESWIKEYNENEKCGYSWNRYLWSPQGKVYKHEIKPFKNNTHPFIIAKYNIDEKDNFYGLFRDLKPIQDSINVSEVRISNMLSTMKVIYEADAVMDADDFFTEVQKDNAVVEVRDGALKENKIQFVQHHADIQALTQRSEVKKSMAKIISGLNDEALAMAANRQSGVAIAQRRELGMLGLQYYVSSADNADRLMYEKVLSFMEHYFTKRQVFRITDKKRADKYFEINTNPQNTLRIGKFDLVYKTTLKQQGAEERFAHWSEIFKTISATRPDLVSHLLPAMLKDVDSQIVDDIEEIMQKVDEQNAQAAQANQPMQQQAQQLEFAQMQAKVAADQSKAQKMQAQAQLTQQQSQLIAQEAQAIASGAQNTQALDKNAKDFLYDSKRR